MGKALAPLLGWPEHQSGSERNDNLGFSLSQEKSMQMATMAFISPVAQSSSVAISQLPANARQRYGCKNARILIG
jgi:hypothetical protein